MKKKTKSQTTEPYMLYEASASSTTTSTRRNLAGSIERTDRFRNIDDGLVPFRSSVYGDKGLSSVSVRDAVILCQKCYYNFSTFRNIIDLMTEFSVNDIYFRGGSQKSRDFFTAWSNKVGLNWDFQDKFFREYYRSGNVFTYRFDALIKPADVRRISQVFAEELPTEGIPVEKESSNQEKGGEVVEDLIVEKMVIPSRYIVLNPADIQMVGTSNFGWGMYQKTLTEYEIARLRNPQTEEDVEVLKALPLETQKQIKSGLKSVIIPLDLAKINMIFYKKQDYEPFAVPMGYPVLEDINFKAEMKKIDMAIARTMQQIILLVTNGTDPDKGGINPKNIEAFKKLFENQSVGRVLVADYTTKAEFVIPEIADLLDPKKYEVIDRDINQGLNNIFVGGEKFANQQQKVELFVARLEQARKAFLNNFLIPEIKRIAKAVGFKNYPTPYFEDVELKDNTNYAKIYARLMELGILTPEQGFKAIETNTLPDPTMMEEEQKTFKSARDKGLYEPLVGGAKTDDKGRPQGTAAPKKVTPIGSGSNASTPEYKFSLKQVKAHFDLANELEEAVVAHLKQTHSIKRMSKLQKEVATQVTHLIMANEEPAKWQESIATYCESPVDKNKERVEKVIEIAATHNVEPYLASILLASKINGQTV